MSLFLHYFPMFDIDRRAKGYVSFIPTDKRAPKFLIPIRYCPDDYATNPDKYSTQLFSAEVRDRIIQFS